MAAPLTPDRAPIQAELLARVAAGAPVSAVCRQADMPSHVTLLAWRRRYPEFDAALAAARARGTERRRWGFDEARAGEVLARLRAGEPLRTIIGRRGASVSAVLYRRWMGTQGAFCEEVNRLLAERRGLRAAASGGGPPRAEAVAFDPAVADKIVVAVGRGLPVGRLGPGTGFPTAAVVARWRREDAEFGMAMGVALRVGRRARALAARAAGPEPRVLKKILAATRAGESLSAMAGRPGLPSRATLYRWRTGNRAFAEALEVAWEQYLDSLSDRLDALAERPGGFVIHRREIRALIRKIARLEARVKRRGG